MKEMVSSSRTPPPQKTSGAKRRARALAKRAGLRSVRWNPREGNEFSKSAKNQLLTPAESGGDRAALLDRPVGEGKRPPFPSHRHPPPHREPRADLPGHPLDIEDDGLQEKLEAEDPGQDRDHDRARGGRDPGADGTSPGHSPPSTGKGQQPETDDDEQRRHREAQDEVLEPDTSTGPRDQQGWKLEQCAAEGGPPGPG